MKEWLRSYLQSSTGRQIIKRANEEDMKYLSYPMAYLRFNAFDIKKEDIKVVLAGYAPLAEPNVSNGYAFSTFGIPNKQGDALMRQVDFSFGYDAVERNYDFSRWQKQGVFLLNEHLSTRWDLGEPSPYVRWDKLFWDAMQYLVLDPRPKVFILILGDDPRHAGFNALRYLASQYGSRHLFLKGKARQGGGFIYDEPYFRLANEFLVANGREPVSWE